MNVFFHVGEQNYLSFSVGIEIGLVYRPGGRNWLLFCARVESELSFVWGSIDVVVCGWSNLTEGFVCGPTITSFWEGMKIYLVLIWVVEIFLMSVWEVESNLILVWEIEID